MACQSVAPIFKFTYFGAVTTWPQPPAPPKHVLHGPNGDPSDPRYSGKNDPYKKIIDFNCTMGLGDQSSKLNITLSGFHCDPKKNVGRVAIFECNTFKFGGMIKSIVHTENQSGQQTQIVMSDMKESLARYDLFINEWHDTTDVAFINDGGTWIQNIYTGWNCRNIHRQIESDDWGGSIRRNKSLFGQDPVGPANYGTKLPDMIPLVNNNVGPHSCTVFGTHTDGKLSQGTTTYYQILQSLVERQARWYNTATYPLWIYLVGLRNIARDEIPYVGTNAKNMSLLELINNVCEEAGYDWTFHNPSADNNRIEMRFVDKKAPTTFGEIKNRIEQAKRDKVLLSYSLGAEFKNEKTRRVVVGSRVNYIKELYMPYGENPGGRESNGRLHANAYVLGFENDGTPIMSTTSDFNAPGSSVELGNAPVFNIENLAIALETTGFGGFNTTWNIEEAELLATGTMATWKLWGILWPNSLSGTLLSHLGIDIQSAFNKIAFNSDMHTLAQSCVEAVKFTTKKSVGELVYEELCYPWIKNFYDTYYGKYYMALLPKNVCFYDLTGRTGQTNQFLGQGSAAFMSDEPTESAWPDSIYNNVIGLQDWELFKDSSGKTTCFCGIAKEDSLNRSMNLENGTGQHNFYFDPASMQGDFAIGNGGSHLYTKAEIDGRAYLLGTAQEPVLGILIKMPNMIPQRWADPNGSANNMGLRALKMLLGDYVTGFPQAGGTTDFSYANVFKETLAAGRYDRIAIPMKSNVVNYGPWLSHARQQQYWSDGGVELKMIEDLNPWTYGGYSGMNTAGTNIATKGVKNRLKYESGSMTLAGTPYLNMEAGGSSGFDPMISSIVCKIDKGGAITTYNFETYTQKYGQSAEALNNFTKLNIGARRQNFNVLKEMNAQVRRAFAEGMRVFGSVRDKFFEQASVPLSASSSSLNNVLIMSYPDGAGSRRIEAGIDKKFTSDYFQDQTNYDKYAIVSLDMIFSPIGIPGGASNMPGLSIGGGGGPYLSNASRPRKPPVASTIILPILTLQLNPYTSAAMMGAFGAAGSGAGFWTEYIAYGSDPGNTYNGDTESQSSFRAAALRGPLLLHSWGYDLDGNPVPGGGAAFNGGWLENPASWPCGPIDLRWDNDRGVWVSPTSTALVVATLTEDLSPDGSAPATVNKVFSNNGGLGQIIVTDFIGVGLAKGSKIIAYHYGNGPTYTPLAWGGSFIKGDAKGCDTSGGGDPIPPTDQHVVGFDQGGKPALFSLDELFDWAKVGDGGGCKNVLGYEEVSERGLPCMIDIPVVDCSGNAACGSGTDPL